MYSPVDFLSLLTLIYYDTYPKVTLDSPELAFIIYLLSSYSPSPFALISLSSISCVIPSLVPTPGPFKLDIGATSSFEA